MKLISITTLATAAFAAAIPEAVPQAGSSKPLRFSGMSLRSGSPIQFSSINANGGSFWIGKKTETYCPADTPGVGDACKHATKNQTIFDYLNAKPTLFLDTSVTGGQQVYVNTATGRLRFTSANKAKMDGTPKKEGFTTAADAEFQFEKNDWLACPEGPKGTYGVFAASRKDGGKNGCLGFTWKVDQVEDSVPSAWQYN